MNNSTLRLAAGDVRLRPGDRVARVPVSLSEPARQTMAVRYTAQNGTVNVGTHYVATTGYLSFHPGEQHKVVEIPLLRDFSATQSFKLVLSHPQNQPALGISRATALISGDPALTPAVVVPRDAPLPRRPTGLSLVFSEDFTTDFAATDSGFRPDGTPCWRTRLSHGRSQPGNRELGWYSDSSVNPNTTPLVRDASNRLCLQAEHFPEGVLDITGHTIPCAWDVPNYFFRYSSSILTTQHCFNQILPGSYVEARLTLPLVRGTWPGLWMIAADLTWPSIELDLVEGFFLNSALLSDLGTTVHWKTASNAHAMFALKLAGLGIDLTQPHVWGCHWGAELVTFFCDDTPYFAVPASLFPPKPCYLKIDLAVGGLVGEPPSPTTTLPARMPLEWVRIWAPPAASGAAA